MSGLKAFGAQKESVGLKFTQVKDSLQEDDDGGGRVPLWKRTFYPFEPWIIRWEISVSGLITSKHTTSRLRSPLFVKTS